MTELITGEGVALVIAFLGNSGFACGYVLNAVYVQVSVTLGAPWKLKNYKAKSSNAIIYLKYAFSKAYSIVLHVFPLAAANANYVSLRSVSILVKSTGSPVKLILSTSEILFPDISQSLRVLSVISRDYL